MASLRGSGQVNSIMAIIFLLLSINTKSGFEPFPEDIKTSAGIVSSSCSEMLIHLGILHKPMRLFFLKTKQYKNLDQT